MLAFLLATLPWISLALSLVALYFFLIGLFFSRTGVVYAYGRVVGHREDSEGLTPIMAFQEKGKEYRFPVAIRRGGEPWPVGYERIVCFPSYDPTKAVVDDSLHRLRSAALFALPAASLFLIWSILHVMLGIA